MDDMRSRSESKAKRRRRATDLDGGGGGVDLISGLADDLLVRILELLPDTRDAVRTHALSRRWRGLWTGVAALRFNSGGAAERYIAFVNNTLALRAAACSRSPAHDSCISPALKHLAISFNNISRVPAVSAAAALQGWIRYAAQQEVKSFVLKLDLLPSRHFVFAGRIGDDDDDVNNDDIENDNNPVMALDEADICTKMESLHLGLGSLQLRVLPSSPTVVLFASLADLSLDDIKLPALSRFLSSACCPHLRRLRLASLDLSTMDDELLIIEADELLELSLDSMYELQFLEIRTPVLRVLRMKCCLELDGFTVSAPKLEDLMVWIQQPLQINDVHGDLSRVETLKIQLFPHGDFDGDDDKRNDVSIHLLQYCRLTKRLEVSFHVEKFDPTEEQRNDIITGRIPQLPHVTSLAVRVILPERHSTGPGVASLLAQCSNVKYLSLHLCYFISIKQKHHSKLDLLCDNNSCHWKSHNFSLSHLEEVEFKMLIGTNCEFQFIQSTLARATKIQKVTISFDRCRQKGSTNAFELMPPIDGGSWTNCNDVNLSYMWRRYILSMSED